MGEMGNRSASSSRRDRNRERMRERVLRAAIECFVEKGFEATTMDEIARRADVARATVFNHFGRKDAFLSAYLAERRQRLSELIAADASRGVDPSTRLYNAFALLAAFNERARNEVSVLISAWWRQGGSTASEPATGSVFAELIREGQQAGAFAPDVDPDLIGAVLLDGYVGTLLRWVAADETPFDLGDALAELARLILDGIRAKPPSPL
jgi:TetR/AcrR family transcriptional regulator, cholesterol catabolism regulator